MHAAGGASFFRLQSVCVVRAARHSIATPGGEVLVKRECCMVAAPSRKGKGCGVEGSVLLFWSSRPGAGYAEG